MIRDLGLCFIAIYIYDGLTNRVLRYIKDKVSVFS